MKDKKRILIAPLDWGLGHATRCIPVIRELLRQGDDVLIASEGKVEQLLKKEFPDQLFIALRGYRIRYSSFLPVTLSIAFQIPRILFKIFSEHRQLKKIIRDYRIQAVISDNRYGLWNKKIHSVLIIHQVMIKCPRFMRFLEPVLYRIHKFFIANFDACWIPDDLRELSGDLAHRYSLPSNAQYIGTLSRWKQEEATSVEKKYDVLAVISGPEPSRTSFEKLLIEQLSRSKLHSMIVLGNPGEKKERQINENLKIVSHLESKKLFEAMSSSELVICRAGYSSIMDLIAIRKNAILIPTRGQTEQVYLAGHLKKKNLFFSLEEKKFRLEDSIKESKKFSVKNFPEAFDGLAEVITGWREKINES